MTEPAQTHVVTCFLRHRGAVLLLRRSDKVGSYAGRWGAVAGHAEGDPEAAAMQEITEETGLDDAVTRVRSGEPFPVTDHALGTRSVVHPFLFDCTHRDVSTNWETTETAWVSPVELLRRDTVPELWTSYERVAPTVDTVANDATHGSTYISLRALEVLRDRAAVWAHRRSEGDARTALMDCADALLAARPSMTALGNRVHRVMDACAPDFAPRAVSEEAHAAIGRALDADADTARRAAGYVAGRAVLTLSRSGTVLDALRHADPPPKHVFITESRPNCEGVYTAETLAGQGLDVTLLTDAAVASVLDSDAVEVVLVGADTVLPSGAVVNKTGTHPMTALAREWGLPCYVAASIDKVSTNDTPHLEEGPDAAIYDGSAPIRVRNPTFDVTPSNALSGIITEQGILHPSEIRDVAYELGGLQRWRAR